MDGNALKRWRNVLSYLQYENWEADMKLNLDVIREILLAVAEYDDTPAKINTGYLQSGYSQKDVCHNAKELIKALMIEAEKRGTTPDGKHDNYLITDLLPQGGYILSWIDDLGRLELLKSELKNCPNYTLKDVYFAVRKLKGHDIYDD